MRVRVRVKSISLVAACLLGIAISASSQTIGTIDSPSRPARYLVRLIQVTPPRLAVTASVPVNGVALEMETTRPGDVPEVGSKGWPALVRNLRASGAMGRPLELKSIGTAGWELAQPYVGNLKIEYEVDYSGPAAGNWPAPREAAFADNTHFVFVGRSLFITTREVRSSIVTFALPRGWRAVTPWRTSLKSQNAFSVAAAKDLTQNLVVLSQTVPREVTAGGFRLLITLIGHWEIASTEVDQVLRGVVPQFARLMGFKERENYSVILLPIREFGGESYRQSFAFTVDQAPARANRAVWGRTIAHEIFHYWNGSRLRGSDYASSQWFQEGFTDYAADLAMVSSGLITPDEFRQQLSKHIRNYHNLATPLAAPGNRKGPPLYSGGALVAFCWDVQIRHTTGGRRNLGDFLKALWRHTDHAQKSYEGRDILAALDQTSTNSWEAFLRAYVTGTQKLPLEEIMALTGLRLAQGTDGSEQVELDPRATARARSLWRALVATK